MAFFILGGNKMIKHNSYLDSLKLGDLVAFKLYYKNAKMYSGKIVAMGNTRVEVQTKNGKRFFIEKNDIQWVNTNGKWPRFVMNAFKGIDVESDVLEENDEKDISEGVEEVQEIFLDDVEEKESWD